jgi:methyl-accepting chemotaxis protein
MTEKLHGAPPRTWTFGRKIGAGFAATVALTVLIGALSIHALRSVVTSKDRVITVYAQVLIDAERLNGAVERRMSSLRGYLFAREDYFLEQFRGARADIAAGEARLHSLVASAEGQRALAAMERAEAEYHQAADQIIALRRADASSETIVRAYHEKLAPRRDELEGQLKTFVARERQVLEEASQVATDAASQSMRLVLLITALALGLAAFIAFLLTRALTAMVGSSVGKVQSSSAELQATASQQATGAKEQATAMSEITTTITELLATSRQISESAQRVTQVAQQATAAARSGDATVDRGDDALAGTRRQIDLVVGHMLDLGKKSQQIGVVLDIVSELAEQTNILAINATIEAAGAGDSGKRFAVVAEEIRKLADRVGGSTKEIRGLIDDVRSAVNTTVMTTETGSKAVDSTSKQFSEVAAAFKQIATLVSTTLDAAREIELSTKQQTTAVEQVNIAIANVSQTTRETEASSAQTLQTVSQLAGLSRDLLRLVRAEA